MGTNYYLHQKQDCECCGRPFEPMHIGKSSCGWCFALHVMPDDNINTLEDWIDLWSEPGSFIHNEYGEKISTDDMLEIITGRRKWDGSFPCTKRHTVDGSHCIGHGNGTWDYIIGEFS